MGEVYKKTSIQGKELFYGRGLKSSKITLTLKDRESSREEVLP
jgi:hypothetical protein